MSHKLTQLTPNLWIAKSSYFATNSGIFIDSERAALLDPCMLPSEIGAIADFLAEMATTPQTLILTHSHWDHILGPERFPEARIIAHANYLAEVIGDREDRILQQIAEWEAEAGIERPSSNPFRIPSTDETFTEQCSLKVGDALTLSLVHAPGHASDQLVAYDPGSATLWASDILSDLEIPFISHSLAAYEKTLEMLSQWEIRLLVPGHGNHTASPGEIRSRFVEDMAYLSELRGAVERAIQNGRSVEETVAVCTEMTYRYPAENSGPHRLNIESVYLELGGAADPTSVGWNQTASA